MWTSDKGLVNSESLPWLGKCMIGTSGLRFVQIDNVDTKQTVDISEARAVLMLRDLVYVGSFKCSDKRITKIRQTGGYTVQIKMQEFLWDGIKRDRLVWLGDMHPGVFVINCVFGE